MTVHGYRGGIEVRNPLTGKKKRFAAEQEAEARELAEKIAEMVWRERLQKALDAGRPTIAILVDAWVANEMRFQAWDDGTRDNYKSWFGTIRRELGQRVISGTTGLDLHNWLGGFAKNADQWNKYRYALILLWKYGAHSSPNR